jgi:ATP-dependent helicase/nuclease subunit A
MSGTKWTEEQYAAITQKDCNLLVAAAAGAGKTAVLVKRIIQKIIDEKNPIDIDSLLVVTFTNAAATEMRERIGAAISKAIEENKESKAIHRQLALINKASITTIHSFCLDVIRSNFQSIDIDPNFRILDETEATLLKAETLNEIFEEIYENGIENAPDFFDLLETYGNNRDDRKIQDMVLSIYSFVQSYPWPEQWLDRHAESFNAADTVDFADSQWGGIIFETVKIRLNGLQIMMEAACGKLRFAAGLEKYLPVFEDDVNNLRQLMNFFEVNEAKWDEISCYLKSIDFATLPRCAKDADKDIQEEVRKVRDELKAYIKNLKEEVFLLNSEEIMSDLKMIYPLLKCITRLVSEFSSSYSRKKQQRASVDFNDLEHFCLKILSDTDDQGQITPTKVAEAYKDKYCEILVDEYQDSNMVQEIIISMISREDRGTPNVFMVGDVKQSIYRFRQARPELFLDKYNHYSSQPESLYRKILLFKNFRSRKEVVDGVNFIFRQIMSESVGELDYSEAEKLNPGAGYPEAEKDRIAGGKVELHIIETNTAKNNADAIQADAENEEDNEEASDEEEILDNLQKEARMVANRIIKLLQPDENGRKFSVLDKKTNKYRDLQFSDIVILLRTTKTWTEVFEDELSKAAIPAFADTGSGFFRTPEVQVMLSLLQIIDNPFQDIPLLSVLRSPVANFSTDDLAELRLADRKAPLYEALNILASGENETCFKAKLFINKLRQWRDMSLYMPTHKLIWQLYNDTGYFSIVGAMHDGERKQANLRVLFERSLQFESTSYKGLFNFISFIDRLKTNKGDMGSAKILGENDNVVRLMSIHKSKGLEFPVVFLCGCGKKFNLQDMHNGILLHQELGFGPEFVDYKKRIKYPSVPKLAIAQKLKIETYSEEMRILYVAMTRAREKLIVTGAVNNIQKASNKWLCVSETANEKFPAYDMLKAQNYLDWICPAVMRHDNSAKLRDAAGIGKEYAGINFTDESIWKVCIYSESDITTQNVLEQNTDADEITREWLDGGVYAKNESYDEINRRLSWKYKYNAYTEIPTKMSVTEMKRFFSINNEGEDSPPALRQTGIRKPAFLQERKGMSSAEKGTVMHFVMQHLNFYDNDIEKQLESLVVKELITEQQAESVDKVKIKTFVSSDICRRMLNSGNFYREVPFNIELSVAELYPDLFGSNTEDKVLLQGVVDCYFEENNKIVLIDYKTDNIRNVNKQEIKDKYGLQISYYARALELLTGLEVSERYIYMFASAELIGL